MRLEHGGEEEDLGHSDRGPEQGEGDREAPGEVDLQGHGQEMSAGLRVFSSPISGADSPVLGVAHQCTGAASSKEDEETLSPDPIPYVERPGSPSSRAVPDLEAAGEGEGDAASCCTHVNCMFIGASRKQQWFRSWFRSGSSCLQVWLIR